MTTRRGKRLAHRGDRRYMESSRRAGLTPHPWWWDYPAIHARLNPDALDWYTLKRRAGLPLNEYAPLGRL